MPPNKWTKTFPFTLLSIYALALLLPSLAEFSQAAAPWLLALHQNWFPQLTNPGIPAQKRAACTKFANSEIPARNFAKLPALKNYASHNGAGLNQADLERLTYDKDKQKVVPPGAFSDPATWKVIPPGEFRLQCARPVGLMWRDHWEWNNTWRDHWGWTSHGGHTPLNLL